MRYEKELKALYDAFLENEFDCSKNEFLAPHTTFRIGGPAPLTVWPSSRAQLIQVLSPWREFGGNCPICVIGDGSNVLFSDDGYSGLVVITNRAGRIVFEEDEADDRERFRNDRLFCQIYAKCGASLTMLVDACADRALSGMDKQPLEYPSAGQVFKRPVDNFAGHMIEIAGLKGYSIGGAQVSEKHMGFIINRGGATAEDVIALIRFIQDEVEKVYRHRLECELKIMTDDSEPDQE
jgi:UDP-N-acetylenolpyruvoylglucosamine reductase